MADEHAVDRVGGRPRDPGNDVAILDAALDLLIEDGFGGASIEAIAKRAGVAKMTVYRRWKSKEDLFLAALEHARPPADANAGSIGELVVMVSRSLSETRFRRLMARVVGASVDHPKLVGAYVERFLRPRLSGLARLARDAVEQGEFPEGTDPAVIEDAFAGAIGFVLLRGEEVPEAEIAGRLRNMLRHLGHRGDLPLG
ncbi:TetR/AcrR family transcriptional regulator [Amycolatopsis sp. NPDC102389]|uniref:TetR/AcrR family transcriptional regulator n=1 Tax=Amycolatopsis sp. NPDC102389 TaxID=3363941 RepID=UPI003827E6D6